MIVKIIEQKDIKYFLLNEKEYITIADLERLTGLNASTIRQWKQRDKIIEGIDYRTLENPHLVLINIKSEFINNELIKRGIEPLQ